MTALGVHLATFLREHLPKERSASPHTCEAYATSFFPACSRIAAKVGPAMPDLRSFAPADRDFQLLIVFAARRLGIAPSALTVEKIDANLILAFLDHLESDRGNAARTRNARLAAINALFRFLEYRLPDCLDQARRIHAIPMKKTDEALVAHLGPEEIQALLDAPDPRTSSGTRDRAMLHIAFAAGLRVSELTGLCLTQQSII